MTATTPISARERRRLESVWQLAARLELVAATADRRVYSVPSSSRPDTAHTVTLRANDRARCDCECGQLNDQRAPERRRACVHVASALLSLAWARAQRAGFPRVCRRAS